MTYSFVPDHTLNIGLTLYKRAQQVSHEVRSELQLHIIYTTCKIFQRYNVKLTFWSIIRREQSLAIFLVILTGRK